jgi:hypothetical protein
MASAEGRRRRQVKELFVLAKEGPLNPYKTWLRLVKEDLATQPTIRTDLEEMSKKEIVRVVDTDEKARGGEPSHRYELTLKGIVTLISDYDLLGDKADDANQFASHVAKKYRGLLPHDFVSGSDVEYMGLGLILDMWSDFIREKVDVWAWRRLQVACRLVGTGPHVRDYQTVGASFFMDIADILTRFTHASTPPEHDAWMQAASGSEVIRQALVNETVIDLVHKMTAASALLIGLPPHSCDMKHYAFDVALANLLESVEAAGAGPPRVIS